MGPRSFAGWKVQGTGRHSMPMTPTEGLAICARAPTPVSRRIKRRSWRQRACTECLGSSPVGSTASFYMQLRCRHESRIAIQPKMMLESARACCSDAPPKVVQHRRRRHMFAHLLEDPVGGVEVRHVPAAPAAIGVLVGGVIAGAGVNDADDDGGRGVDARVGPVHLGAVGVLRHWKAQRMVSALPLSHALNATCSLSAHHAVDEPL